MYLGYTQNRLHNRGDLLKRPGITQAMEDYLKAIYKLSERHEQAPTSALAEYLKVTPASVTNMCKKLAALNLVTYEPYQGVKFTPTGEKLALEIVRHHRLIELYLSTALGVPWDRVHGEAEKLEHALSEDLEERIAAALGDPQFDPHGAPIPSRSGVVSRKECGRLVDMKAGDRLVVVEVDDNDAEILRYIGQMGLYPGVNVHLLAQAPFEGPLTLDVDGQQHHLSYQVAKTIMVALQQN